MTSRGLGHEEVGFDHSGQLKMHDSKRHLWGRAKTAK